MCEAEEDMVSEYGTCVLEACIGRLVLSSSSYYVCGHHRFEGQA